MKKILFLFCLISFIAIVQPAMAETGAGESRSANQTIALACGFGLAIASAACGIAQGIAIRSAAEGVARNPGTADVIRGILIIGLAFIESLAIYVLLIAFMLYFKWA